MSVIKSIALHYLSFPIEKPFCNHVRQIDEINGVYVRINTLDGLVGEGFVYGLSVISYEPIAKVIKKDLIAWLIFHDSLINDMVSLKNKWVEFWDSYYLGNITLEQRYALAIFDIAIWDIFLKFENISLHHYLGAAKTAVQGYGTTGWLSLTDSELVGECKSYLDRGITAFKVRIGHSRDYERLYTLRKEVGNDVILMLDANQRFSVDQAIEASKQLEEFNILWLEEPTDNALPHIQSVKENSVIPIAVGENIFCATEFMKICQSSMADYLQPDVPRCGGITGFCRMANIIRDYNFPLCNHLLYELSTSLVAAYPNGYMLEYDNFLQGKDVLTQDFTPKNGFVSPPVIPGTGVEVEISAIKKYGVFMEIINCR